jgi:hypothetical protein
MALPPATMADARGWVEDSRQSRGHEMDESLHYHLQAGWCLDVSAVKELSTSNPGLYLKVLEYCFTTYPEMRGRIGPLLRVEIELIPRVLEVFERACASQPRAAVAAYLNGALNSRPCRDTAIWNVLEALERVQPSEMDEHFSALLTHPLMDPTVYETYRSRSMFCRQHQQVSNHHFHCVRVYP